MQKVSLLRFSGLALIAMPTLALAGGAAALFAPSAARGQLVYNKACVACHGENGDGNGPGAAPLNPKPRDFTGGLYKYRSTPIGELPTDADLLKVVNDGIAHSQMPAWSNALSDQERLDVVAYIKNFCASFKDAKIPDTLVVPEAPPSTPALVQEGRKVYMAQQCWSCHGTQGQGNGPAAKILIDNWGNPIKPVNFTWEKYKRGNDPASIYKTFSTGLNGTPMPSFAGTFLFGGDREIDAPTFAAFSAIEIKQLQEYFNSQPTEAELNAMPAEKKNEIELRRKWALVYYIRSLIKKPNIVQWLFTDDMELTR